MPTKDLSLFKAMFTKMNWLEQRQKVLAENIANANTPDYRPHDLVEPDFKSLLSSSTSKITLNSSTGSSTGVIKTDSQHIGMTQSSGTQEVSKTKNQRDNYETAPDGNSVIIEEQLLKANQTAAEHRFITNLYAKQVNILRTALGKK